MKKKYILIFVILGIIGIIVSCILYNNARTKHQNSYQIYNERFIEGHIIFYGHFDCIFISYGEFPDKLEGIISYFKAIGAPQEAIDHELTDPLRKEKSYLKYIPMYGRSTGKREGCIVLSSGIDGKINNTFSDTIYVDSNIPLKL